MKIDKIPLKDLIKKIDFKIIDHKNPIVKRGKRGKFIVPTVGRVFDEKKLDELGKPYLTTKKYEVIMVMLDLLNIDADEYTSGKKN